MHSIKAVVAIPAIRLSTSEARRAMPKSVPIGDAVVNLGALTLLLQGLRTGNGDLISDGMHDRLHEPYRWRLIKGGQEVKEAALAGWSLGMRHQRGRAKHLGALRRRARASRESCHGEGLGSGWRR
jgi:homoserine kinase